MKVPFRLRRMEAPQPARALLLLSHEPGALFGLLAQLTTLPRVFCVADGLLVCLDRASTTSFGGAIRLQMPQENLFVPVDAELVPGLLEDEARGLVRDRGLVFLPNGRVLGFEPAKPLKLAALLDAGERRQGVWEPFPTAPRLADHIYRITFDLPEEDPDELLAPGGEDIATDPPRPEEASPISQTIGKAILGAGKAVHGLGKLLGLRGLAAAGANLVGKAFSWAPRLTEEILGKQEAALRELLRRFREGKLEDALRHALPLGGAGGRGDVPASGNTLPTHGLLYSLASLLGGSGGIVGIWFGGQDVQIELAREYRKAAERAAQQGDFRRAALIYAKLLHEYRAAAQSLLRGGLFHDAAIVFLKRLNDRHAAAQAFESAGEFDRALELYRQLEEHLLAAYLLRRLGDEEAAVAEFQAAAGNHAASGDYYAAGNLMLEKAQRPHLARTYFETGWRRRPAGNAMSCAIRLAELHADRGEAPLLWALADEAREFFEPTGNDASAEQFYSTLTKLANRLDLQPLRDELFDRARLGLAVKLRQRAAVETTPGIIVSTFLGRAGHWPAAVVGDAQVAVAAAVKEHSGRSSPRAAARLRLGTGQVTAVARAAHTGELFVGFKSGDVVAFRPATGEVVRIKSGDGLAVTALSAAPEGQALLVLQSENQSHLSSYSKSLDGGYLLNIAMIDAGGADFWLPLVLGGEKECWYLVGDEAGFQLRHVNAVVNGDLSLPIGADQITTALVFATGNRDSRGLGLILYARNVLWYNLQIFPAELTSDGFQTLSLAWTPGLVEANSLFAAPLSGLLYGGECELAGVDEEGVLHWSRLLISGDTIALNGACDRPCEGGFLAATLVRPGLVAAVSKSRVQWLRAGLDQFMLQDGSDIAFPNAVACFTSAATGELLVICRDGALERLALPGA